MTLTEEEMKRAISLIRKASDEQLESLEEDIEEKTD